MSSLGSRTTLLKALVEDVYISCATRQLRWAREPAMESLPTEHNLSSQLRKAVNNNLGTNQAEMSTV